MNEPYRAVRSYLSQSIVVVATDPAAMQRASNGFAAAFVDPVACHLLDDVGMDELAGHAVWLEVGADQGAILDHWLMAFDAFANQNAKPVSVAMTMPMVDVVTARLDGPFEFLVAPGTMDRAGAIADLFMRGAIPEAIYETRGAHDERRLRQLSDEVARIAATLSRLSSRDGGYDAPEPQSALANQSDLPLPEGRSAVGVQDVRSAIRARRMREKFFLADYFADPAWDMLLDLFAARLADQRVPVSSLCIAAAVPATTALRWMKTLSDAGLFVRRSDPRDGRRVFVNLSDRASEAMHAYFAQAQ